jgi:hypothetical protein
MSEWVTKCWGKTRELVDSPFYSKHELEIEVGGYCSLHYHEFRANRFIVQSGLVEVIEMFGPIVRKVLLGPDNTYDVASLVPHMFVVRKSGEMLEEYFADRGGEVRRNDITRIVEGGKLEEQALDSLPYSVLQELWISGTE